MCSHKNKYKRRNIVIRKLENKKNTIILLDNYYCNGTNTNGKEIGKMLDDGFVVVIDRKSITKENRHERSNT